MFLDMANASLVILGASKYDNDSTLDREVFLHGSEAVLSYFKSIKEGLGIEQKNILNLFNSEDTPNQQQNIIQSFISNRRIDDLFVYIIGHGFARSDDFYLFHKTSDKKNVNSSMNVSILLQFINGFGNFRTFVFIDACASGSIHVFDPVSQIMPVLVGYISTADATHMPRSGMSILTSNNKACVGNVLADDNLEEIRSPVFTHELIQLLRKGKRRGQKFGFSINYLREILEERIIDKLQKINRSDLALYSRPEVTDLTDFDNSSIAVLSDIGLFPNNDQSNALIIKAAKRVRLTHFYIKDLNEQIAELQSQLEIVKLDIEAKDSKLQNIITENEHLSLSLNEQRTLKVKAIAQKTGFMYATITLLTTVLIIIVISTMLVQTINVDQIVQLVKKGK